MTWAVSIDHMFFSDAASFRTGYYRLRYGESCCDPSLWLDVSSVFSVKLVLAASTGCLRVQRLKWRALQGAVYPLVPLPCSQISPLMFEYLRIYCMAQGAYKLDSLNQKYYLLLCRPSLHSTSSCLHWSLFSALQDPFALRAREPKGRAWWRPLELSMHFVCDGSHNPVALIDCTTFDGVYVTT